MLRLALQSFLIVSDPAIAKHILKDNPKGYSKVNWHNNAYPVPIMHS